MKPSILGLIALGLAMNASSQAAPSPSLTLTPQRYNDWNCMVLSAGPYRVAVAWQIGGRIVEYSKNGVGPIWLNAAEKGKIHQPDPKNWWNYGGYKTWPSPQSQWGWPPEFQLDAGRARITPWRKNGKLYGLSISGQPSAKSGIAFMKRIHLDPKTGTLHLWQTMRALRENKAPVRLGVWSITQVKGEGTVVAPLNRNSRHPDKIYFYSPESKQSRQWSKQSGFLMVRNLGQGLKYGVDTDDGWMAYLLGKQAYVIRFPPRVRGQEYPDESSSAQIWTNGPPLHYIEMEIAGPVVTLKPGQSTTLEEEWSLVDLPKPVKSPGEVLPSLKTLRARGALQPVSSLPKIPF